MIAQKKRALRGVSTDRLYASQHGKTVQFYRMPQDGHKEYLKADSTLIPRLAQKEYDQNVLKVAELEEKMVGKLVAFYDRQDTAELQYEKMLPAKRLYVKPIREPDDEYVRRWLAEPYPELVITDDSEEFPNYYNDSGEIMRSKSEMIIAEMLRKKDIPYRHEYPLTLWDPEMRREKTIYPDFTILRVRDRQVLYWEHLGLLEKQNYLKKNLLKIRLYEINGYFPGQKLILSSETSFAPLNIRVIDQMIEAFCK